MENFETEFSDSDFFDELSAIFSEAEGEAYVPLQDECPVAEVCLEQDAMTPGDMISMLRQTFEQNCMNEHLGTVELLGDLGYTDMLMYYCIVMDSMYINNEEEREQLPEVITPSQYIAEKENSGQVAIEFKPECTESKLVKARKILGYLKNKEFKVLSNTFYMDGSDFIVFLQLKSVVGYNLRITIVIKCESENKAAFLQESAQKLHEYFNSRSETDE